MNPGNTVNANPGDEDHPWNPQSMRDFDAPQLGDVVNHGPVVLLVSA
jgi:hypothetical protein